MHGGRAEVEEVVGSLSVELLEVKTLKSCWKFEWKLFFSAGQNRNHKSANYFPSSGRKWQQKKTWQEHLWKMFSSSTAYWWLIVIRSFSTPRRIKDLRALTLSYWNVFSPPSQMDDYPKFSPQLRSSIFASNEVSLVRRKSSLRLQNYQKWIYINLAEENLLRLVTSLPLPTFIPSHEFALLSWAT